MRRLVTIPATIIACLIGLVLSPLLLGGAAIVDIISRRPRWPRLRVVFFVLGALVIEVGGLAFALSTWILTGFGLVGSNQWRWRLYRRNMGWYTHAMLRLVARVLGTTIEWRDHADLSSGPVVLLARHTSFFDALIPSTLLSRRNSLLAHHVIAQGLRYAPSIDVVGHRFPTHFVKRTPGEGSRELGPIRNLGSLLSEQSAAVIFPEGTFRTPDRFERVVRRLKRRQPELAERAKQLQHVLPPRPSGSFVLLEGARTGDVVICVNTGLEPFGSVRSILDNPTSDQPIVIETWRIPRDHIPTDPDAFDIWLFEQFVAIDDWVAQNSPAENDRTHSCNA